MKKTIFLLLAFVSIGIANAQNVTIKLEDLAVSGKVKSTTRLGISDHTIDGKSITNHIDTLFITGVGSRGLVFKNFHGQDSTHEYKIVLRNVKLGNASNGVTIKMNANNWYTALILQNTFINGKKGGAASQLIYYEGEFNKGIRIEGDWISTLDQGRHANAGRTDGGAMIQVAGSYTARCNDANWDSEYVIVRKMRGRNANDEMVYIGHNHRGLESGYVAAGMGSVIVDSIDCDGAGREYVQITGAKKRAIVKNLMGRHGSLERSDLHWSGVSFNGGNGFEYLGYSHIEGVAQPVYAGTFGATGRCVIENNIFLQDTTYSAPGALYLKGDKNYSYTLERNYILARDYSITADGVKVTMVGNSNYIRSFRGLRKFNGGEFLNYTPPPTIREFIDQLQVIETTPYEGQKSYRYIYNGMELKP
jgi:hypothetical protein